MKLLKLLQEEINRRTRQLQDATGAAETLNQQQRQQYAALSAEQGQLGDALRQLLQTYQAAPETNQDNPPEPGAGRGTAEPRPPGKELP